MILSFEAKLNMGAVEAADVTIRLASPADAALLARLRFDLRRFERRRRGEKVARGKREARRPWTEEKNERGSEGRQNAAASGVYRPFRAWS